MPSRECRRWRLIPFLEESGKIQMAIDAWLLEQYRLGLCGPVLRFYSWSPPAISLGYHQHKWPNFWENLTWQGGKLQLVRRPTGGRAVLHQGDLTYAVITSNLGVKRLESYEFICRFLIEGWRKLGIELSYGMAGRGYIHNPNCFGTATSADLVLADGSKLIGSAQLRRDGAILQHGSIRLKPDVELFAQVFGEAEKANLDINFDTKDVMDALIQAAAECFGGEFVVENLSDEEWQVILETSSKYSVNLSGYDHAEENNAASIKKQQYLP
ncbi:lipoate--protein ligase family protein [Ancylothrix sp. C2]|uniref:lipoate--protein ligase family protein n=1 Tax=Ancylothrix sp. D3o TaxID=2953691 RepID=UPI0021BB9E43|nr:biotin/lipoate A/B protein ligase family protein [Ancylothrix sp. D3o]MCT7950194.1 lipoate--protein ligase family protein [Ancylothrix sp. D3o]